MHCLDEASKTLVSVKDLRDAVLLLEVSVFFWLFSKTECHLVKYLIKTKTEKLVSYLGHIFATANNWCISLIGTFALMNITRAPGIIIVAM